MLPVCPQLTLYHTSQGIVYPTFNKRAAGLPEVVSRDMRSDQDLIPILKYLEHQNSRALKDLNDRFERGGCFTWLNIKNDQDYLHPLRHEPGLFVTGPEKLYMNIIAGWLRFQVQRLRSPCMECQY